MPVRLWKIPHGAPHFLFFKGLSWTLGPEPHPSSAHSAGNRERLASLLLLFLLLLSAAVGLAFARLQGMLFPAELKNASACSWLHTRIALMHCVNP